MTERRRGQRKDRLIQTRVPKDLESTLKDEARKRRLSVSHLIRNLLEDSFNLVDNVVVEVDKVMADSVHMAQTLKRDAERLANNARVGVAGDGPAADAPAPTASAKDGKGAEAAKPSAAAPQPPAAPGPAPATEAAEVPDLEQETADRLAEVYAWQPVLLNRAGECAKCHKVIAKGEQGHMGLTDQPGPRMWLCDPCVAGL